MKQIWSAIFIVSLCFTAVSCGNEGEKEVNVEVPLKSITTIVDSSYAPIDSTALSIMEKMQICTLSDTVLTLPPCDAAYFRVFQFQGDLPLPEGFLVEMIPG